MLRLRLKNSSPVWCLESWHPYGCPLAAVLEIPPLHLSRPRCTLDNQTLSPIPQRAPRIPNSTCERARLSPFLTAQRNSFDAHLLASPHGHSVRDLASSYHCRPIPNPSRLVTVCMIEELRRLRNLCGRKEETGGDGTAKEKEAAR